MKDYISSKDCFDKVHGGWFGKCLGGAAGAKLEGYKKFNDIQDFVEYIDVDVPNDDLDIQLLWLDAIEENGLENLSSDILAKYWYERCWYPFSEYGIFLKNYARGILPPTSGRYNNPFFGSGMGGAIRSEIWAFTNIGNVNAAVECARSDASLDHFGDGVEAEAFLAAVEAYAFFESDVRKLIERGLSHVDCGSRIYRCIKSAADCFEKGEDIKTAQQTILRGFGHPDFTNCVQNVGFIVFSLLYGGGDMRKTINSALMLGYDADCTAASAAAIIGIIEGYSRIKDELKVVVNDTFVCNVQANARGHSIKRLAEDTFNVNKIKDRISFCADSGRPAPQGIFLAVEYPEQPALMPGKMTAVKLIIKNRMPERFAGSVSVSAYCPGYIIEMPDSAVEIDSFSSVERSVRIGFASGVQTVPNKNLFCAEVSGEGRRESKDFGLAGANIWRMYGTFCDALKKEPEQGHPPCHGEGSVLPTLECMVNNYVSLDKLYLDEAALGDGECNKTVFAAEDLINLENAIDAAGQVALYIVQDIEYPRTERVWTVIGNNDAFALTVNGAEVLRRDEMRMWTPYNNCALIDLKKGKNRIIIKLLRRGDALKFSFGLREYGGEYWHRKNWIVDYSSLDKA